MRLHTVGIKNSILQLLDFEDFSSGADSLQSVSLSLIFFRNNTRKEDAAWTGNWNENSEKDWNWDDIIDWGDIIANNASCSHLFQIAPSKLPIKMPKSWRTFPKLRLRGKTKSGLSGIYQCLYPIFKEMQNLLSTVVQQS